MDQPRRQEIELVTEPRTIIGKQTRALRRQGYVPLTVYGPGAPLMNLQAEARQLRRVLMRAGTSKLITVKVNETSFLALAREIQRDSIRGDFEHLDLYAVDLSKAIRSSVRLVFDGEPTIIRNNRAVLTHAMTDIEVECLPTELPAAIHVDMSKINEIGDAFHVSDLAIPHGVKFLRAPEDMIVKISPLAAAAVEPVAATATPEVEVAAKKGKEEEEE